MIIRGGCFELPMLNDGRPIAAVIRAALCSSVTWGDKFSCSSDDMTSLAAGRDAGLEGKAANVNKGWSSGFELQSAVVEGTSPVVGFVPGCMVLSRFMTLVTAGLSLAS
jgi:hypothetical protein